jgi:hypothetical protein
VDFWRQANVFSATDIARMVEIQLIAELAMNMQNGLQDYAEAISASSSARLRGMPKRLPRPGAFVLREFTAGTPLLLEYVVTPEGIVRAVAKA